MNNIQKSYLPSIEILRGIASVLVMLFHFFNYKIVDQNNSYSYFLDINFINEITSFGFLGVQIFFVISGFIIPFSLYQQDFKIFSFPKFLLKRILRIDPPYIVSIIGVLVLAFFSSKSSFYKGTEFKFDLVQILSHFGYFNSFINKPYLNTVYWTLALEFQYYILISLIFPLLINKNFYVRNITLFLLNLSIFIPTNESIFNYVTFFAIGISGFLLYKNVFSLNEFIFSIFISVILTIYFFKWFYIAVALIALLIILKTNISFKIGNFFGKISYSLYLLHTIIGWKLINLSSRFFTSTESRFVIMIAIILLTIFFSYIMYLLVEKPFIKLSKKIKY
jgi:peptidoglycan/LPS O-acetylase OafA/YrhL